MKPNLIIFFLILLKRTTFSVSSQNFLKLFQKKPESYPQKFLNPFDYEIIKNIEDKNFTNFNILYPKKEHKNLKTPHDLDYSLNCEIKQGNLNEIMSLSLQNKILNANIILEYIILNTRTFSIFKNDKIESLINNFDINKIEIKKINYFYPNKIELFCFILNLTQLNKESRLFCSEKDETINDWTNFFENLTKCNENKKKSIEKSMQTFEIEEIEERNNEKVLKEQFELIKESLINITTEEKIKKKKKSIELEKLRIQRKKLQEQRKLLEKTLKDKELIEMTANEIMIHEEKNKLLKEKLNEVLKEMIQIKDKEELEVLNADDQLYQQEKDQIEKETQQMMDIAYENQKLLDFGICLSLSQINNHLTTEQICNKIYETRKESKLILISKCIDNKYFCSSCCSEFIGVSHFTERYNCNKQCNNQFKNNGIIFKS